MANGANLLGKLENPDSRIDLAHFTDREAIGINPSSVYALKRFENCREIFKGAYVFLESEAFLCGGGGGEKELANLLHIRRLSG